MEAQHEKQQQQCYLFLTDYKVTELFSKGYNR